MIKLKNPYRGNPGYHCFACSPDNSNGLQMEFFEDGDEIVSRWNPDSKFEGWHDVLHGGIQATLMDELASWVVFVKLGTSGMTYQMNAKYRAPVRISAGKLTLRAKLAEHKRRIAGIRVELYDGEGRLCTEGMVEYFVSSEEKAREEFDFPGKEAFY